jgi:hypothetical protein
MPTNIRNILLQSTTSPKERTQLYRLQSQSNHLHQPTTTQKKINVEFDIKYKI